MSKGKGEYNLNATDDGTVRAPPAKKSRFSVIYDSEDGSFLGRTAKSWLLITLFYIVYYGCLAGFFGGMLWVFLYSVIQEDKPHLTGQHSLLRLNPGMGFRPQPDIENSLISFTAGQNWTYASYVANLQKLYDAYKKDKPGARYRDCGPGSTDSDPTKVCQFDWDTQLPNCLPENQFGYTVGRPCVILKLNRIFGWLPDPLDAEFPHPTVRCYGENAADHENLGAPIYEPAVGGNMTEASGYFSNAYFPFFKQFAYQGPLVAVVFNRLPANTVVMIECRLGNLRNSQHNRMDREAMVRFDIFMRK